MKREGTSATRFWCLVPGLQCVLTVFLPEGRKGAIISAASLKLPVWTIIEMAWIGRFRTWDAWTFLYRHVILQIL